MYGNIFVAWRAIIDESINQLLRPIADAVSSFIFFDIQIGGADFPLIVAWLVAGGLFFTGYLGFINIRGFTEGIHIVLGRRQTRDDAPGEISAFQALATAVSGTVGIGNIAGVAIAISLGGPGATFWLIVAGFLGMSTKFAECTLGVHYRRENPDGSVSGGPMYYLERGLAEHNMAFLCCIHGDWLSRYRQYVSGQPGRRHTHHGNRRHR